MIRGAALNVFVNCPFDKDYKKLFEAIVFTVTASGYRIRCALEDSDSGDIRFDKLLELIRQCRYGIHDLSRIEAAKYPRFNMPFELGVWMGAKRFGTPVQRGKKTSILVARKYKMPVYLSDLAGNDPRVHSNSEKKVITEVRKFLARSPSGKLLPGAVKIAKEFRRFRKDLPALARAMKLRPSETDAFKHFPEYQEFVGVFVEKHTDLLRPSRTG